MIDLSNGNVLISWGAIIGIVAWIFHELRENWKKLETKVDRKMDAAACDKFRDEEKEARIREREAVRADREARHGMDK